MNRAYVVNATTEVEEHRLSELAAVDCVVLAKVLAADGGLVDVEDHLPVVGARLEHLRTKRYEVVERGQHLCERVY